MLSQRPTFFPATRERRITGIISSARAPRSHQPLERQRRRKDQGRWGQRPSPHDCRPVVEYAVHCT